MIKQIIEQNNLTCSEEEFSSYLNGITNIPEVTFEEKIYGFDELFNGQHQIENITGDINAKYYTLKIIFNGGERLYLQNIIPFINGNKAITDNNYREIIDNHKKDLSTQMIEGYKLQKTIEYFLAK